MINEIIATIFLGLHFTALIVALIGGAIVYNFILDRVLESHHKILSGFVLAFGMFMCCMGLSYFFGSTI